MAGEDEDDVARFKPRPFARIASSVFAPDKDGHALLPRWLFLRALGIIFFSAFYSLLFQIHGLVGTHGILPARDFLDDVAQRYGGMGRIWYAPTFLWVDSSNTALTVLVFVGLSASALLLINVLPRAMVVVCTLSFVSFIAVGQDFADYQSDGMLLEAGFLSFFVAPRGWRPRFGASQPPSRASVFLLLWEWFRIYFESGWVKLASGDPQWRALTAMDHYYENGPLPTWLGWFAQERLPHAFHAATALATLLIELALVWLVFFGRRARFVCFCIVTPLQVGIILTANYAFLNYLVLSLGFLFLDDRDFARFKWKLPRADCQVGNSWRVWGSAAALSWIFYASIAVWFALPDLLLWPWTLVHRARIANRYGLFAVMTEARYEVEFQGSRDGMHWEAYPFRYKPQDPMEAPGIYAPYQPRFEWNLWFASLGSVASNEWVIETEQRLLEGEPSVLALFRHDPFSGAPPSHVRAVLFQYWFTDPPTRSRTGAWWTRAPRGLYAPVLVRNADGMISPEPRSQTDNPGIEGP